MSSSYSWNWKEFNPKAGQADKRERDVLLLKAVKYLNDLGMSSFVSVPVVDRNRTIEKVVHVYPPNSPLEDFFTNKENKTFIKGLNKAIEDTQMWTLDLWDLKEKMEFENDEQAKQRFNEMVGEESDVSDDGEGDDDIKVVKPDKPIFALTADEAAMYHGPLLKSLYELEGIKEYRLWAKREEDGTVKDKNKATKLDCYDAKAEAILDRNSFIGRGSGGPNIGNKLKIVEAYLLSKFEIDYNTFANTIPTMYRKVNIDFDSYDDLVNTNIRRKPSKSRADKAAQQLRKDSWKLWMKNLLMKKFPKLRNIVATLLSRHLCLFHQQDPAQQLEGH